MGTEMMTFVLFYIYLYDLYSAESVNHCITDYSKKQNIVYYLLLWCDTAVPIELKYTQPLNHNNLFFRNNNIKLN